MDKRTLYIDGTPMPVDPEKYADYLRTYRENVQYFTTKKWCTREDRLGFICTLPAGHAGPHIASAGQGEIIAVFLLGRDGSLPS